MFISGMCRKFSRYLSSFLLFPFDQICDTSQALSTLAGMPARHYQLFRFSPASEAVLPDNRIILLLSPTHFHSCLPLPFPFCVLEWVMGTVFACRALPISVYGAFQLFEFLYEIKLILFICIILLIL